MFDKYKVHPFFDEMFDTTCSPKPHYKNFHTKLIESEHETLKEKHELAQLSFLRQGITFTVYHQNVGTERTMPFDFVPIVIPNDDWKMIEKGMAQRTEALNCFLKDIYHEGRILDAGIVPRDLVEKNAYYYKAQAEGVRVPLDNHIFLAGIDLIRDAEGNYMVLEDNLRNPSGMSYVYQNRYVMRQVYPEFFADEPVHTLEHQLTYLHEAMLDHAPEGIENPTAVLLTPGMYNSAYYDHVFLAQQMGIHLVEGRDLLVKDGHVYMKTIRGLERIHIIYRRIDDDFLDPAAFREDSMLGVSGLVDVYKKGNVAILNAIGNGVADDKAMYSYVPDMIKFYLNEEPIIANVKTYRLEEQETRDWVLANIRDLVVKNVGASGGYDMLIGPQADDELIEIFKQKIQETPHQYIAQPTIQLSRAPAFQGEEFYPCHVDLRVFVMRGKETHVLPGGLSRVALKEGSLVVNSSQGGGAKDTWILKNGGTAHA